LLSTQYLLIWSSSNTKNDNHIQDSFACSSDNEFSSIVSLLTLTRYIGPRFVPENAVLEGSGLHKGMDFVPIGFFVLMSAGLTKAAISVEAAMVGVYTGVTFGLLSLFVFVQKVIKEESS
jgi:hypothetical protein